MTAFVIEGIDRSGKSTLASQLRDEFGYKVITVARPSENGWDKAIKEFRKGKEDAERICKLARDFQERADFVLDRFSYSELVYCRVFGRPCDFGWYEKLLYRNKEFFKVIYVTENHEILRDRWEKEEKPVEHITKILAEYKVVLEKLKLQHGIDYVRFKPTENKIESLVKWMKSNGAVSLRSTNIKLQQQG